MGSESIRGAGWGSNGLLAVVAAAWLSACSTSVGPFDAAADESHEAGASLDAARPHADASDRAMDVPSSNDSGEFDAGNPPPFPDASWAPDAIATFDVQWFDAAIDGATVDAWRVDALVPDTGPPPHAAGQTCSGYPCEAGLACFRFDSAMYCGYCGAAGQRACPGSGCMPGLQMVVTTAAGDVFCLDATAAPSSMGGVCGPSGGCAGDPTICLPTTSGSGVCVHCGSPGEPCCCTGTGCFCPFHVCIESDTGSTICR
jgi:hypothetical protein